MGWICLSGINWGKSENAYADKQPFETQQQAIDVLINNDRNSERWDAKNPWPLQNPRLDLFTRELTEKDKAELLEYDKLVKHLALYGGFNINSTSEKAWEALFFSMKGEIVRYLDNGEVKAKPEEGTSFGRFTSPVAAEGELFGSYRTLTDEQIRELAKQMVIQVKQRGPFMGLGDFVNRRLSNEEKGETGYGTKVGQLGALQAAITAAGLNPVLDDEQQTSPHIKAKNFKVVGIDYPLSKYQTTSKLSCCRQISSMALVVFYQLDLTPSRFVPMVARRTEREMYWPRPTVRRECRETLIGVILSKRRTFLRSLTRPPELELVFFNSTGKWIHFRR